ncbi:MAG TPA: NAD(P)/FAD-dependent oxidoreductase [Ktedonobacterales bacterium]|jgi:protoporphyrinogen oxidase|nr:NAD(P)/FAD-dependent oxidoreductase [Ktedonobacterales bacterium]
MARNYAVLGGGVLGLTVALRLLQAGERVTLYEREAEPGGLAAGFEVVPASETGGEPVWLDKFYHHLFRSDTTIIRLIHELGMDDQLDWRRPLTVTLWGGKVYQLDSPLSLLRFGAIAPVARLRTAAALFYLRILLRSPDALEGKTAAAWARRTMGAAPYDTIFGPLFKGKFGAVADEIALPWFWARLHDRTAQLGYIRGGFQRFYNRLAGAVRDLGGTIQLRTRIERIESTGQGLEVAFTPLDGAAPTQTRHVDRVVSTLPTRLTCRLAPQLPDEYRARFDWGRAYGAHCVILALDRPLTHTYWMNVNDPGYPFMVLVEHTNYMPVADYGGRHLVYLGNYRAMDDPLFAASQQEVLRDFLPHLARINPDFAASWVTQSWMFAAPFAQPIVTTDYREHIPPFDTPIEGLYIANMFQVYPHDRGQNYSVDLAERLVRHVTGRA